MKYQTRQALRLAALALIALAGGVVIMLILNGCHSMPTHEETVSAGHNTTLPPLPACLLFCRSEINSTVTSSNAVNRKPAKAKPASAASAARPASTPAASTPAPASAPALPFERH